MIAAGHYIDLERHCYTRGMMVRLLMILALVGTLTADELKPLIVATEVWPPYVTSQPDLPGFDVEVSQRVLAEMGYDLQLQRIPWRRALVQAQRQQVDAVLDAFDDPERRRWLHYPEEPLSTSTSSLFCHRCDRYTTPDLDSLDGVVIAVNRGYQYSPTFDAHRGIDRIEVDSFKQGFHLIRRGRAQYYAVNNRVGHFTLRGMADTDGFHALSPPIAPVEPVYMVFTQKPGHDRLAARFSDHLARFKQTDAYRRILARYGITDTHDLAVKE